MLPAPWLPTHNWVPQGYASVAVVSAAVLLPRPTATGHTHWAAGPSWARCAVMPARLVQCHAVPAAEQGPCEAWQVPGPGPAGSGSGQPSASASATASGFGSAGSVLQCDHQT
eukprot:CAMPEP_0202924124 /NCGR_PEP_ID=MMETSP1392-20130828/78808_1 /ASSEMBLY_ACC=CAM_ASM_000868 /TAXON_ID=225041 /ORGANISM="Chlamydomonas chlamydogama, Strain SAG 11-48b" /LENGTH=112 /DNA_ID=CAMNT_0049617839 /DNA_START=3626 /DNA_END=3960 /DNA_ORIENTATION=-